MDSSYAIKLNNRAASCVENGNFSDAFTYFKQALDNSKSMIRSESSNANGKNDDEHDNNSPLKFGLDDLMDTRDYEMTSCTPSNGGFVYQNAIHIDDSYVCQLASSNLDLNTMVSTVVVFNLALTHHLVAITESDEKTPAAASGQSYKLLLRKASKLYQAVLKILKNSRLHEQGRSSIFFVSSILNNLGHVHNLLDEKEESRYYYCQLVSTLMLVIEHHNSHHQEESERNRKINTLDELTCFFHCLVEGNAAVAPAA